MAVTFQRLDKDVIIHAKDADEKTAANRSKAHWTWSFSQRLMSLAGPKQRSTFKPKAVI